MSSPGPQDSIEISTDLRDALRSRLLPEMTLSDASNPLTAPLPPALGSGKRLSPADRAVRRFTVFGNAIVTGGAGTLGLEAARALLEHGCPGVCLMDLQASMDGAGNTIEDLRSEFPARHVVLMVVDVTDSNAVADAVRRAVEEMKTIEVLLCFAGVVGCTHALEMDPANWQHTLDVNLSGSWFTAQAVAKAMIKQNTGGSITFIASISGHRVNFPQPQVAYNASKAALLQLKSSLAAEWARFGIRVNSISPGYMDTILNEGPGLADAREIWTSRNPMGRMGAPAELVGAVVLLSSPAGRYINGADIIVDGGGHVF
ncbi:hypothetical protein HGRIS_011749 [Hohenbuehelia grisea]|uniref:NAD(P)-binding protein n=1 Tax=Hohenbuehelia grisea TaxID=104357 RepID=A0ABR3JY97_9AGAR